MGLTEADKERLREEESFRAELHGKLAEESRTSETELHKLGANVWSALNSQVGGWLLSTVLVGLVAWAYSDWWKPRQERREALESVRTEIDFRLTVADDTKDDTKALDRLNGELGPVEPDYGRWDLGSLLWKLDSLLGGCGTERPLRKHAQTIKEYGSTPPPKFREELKALRADFAKARAGS